MPLPELRCKQGPEVIPAICVQALAAPQFAKVGTLVWMHHLECARSEARPPCHSILCLSHGKVLPWS